MSGEKRISKHNECAEEPAANSIFDAFNPMLPPNAMPSFGLDAVRHWTEANKEIARFYSDRLKKDLATLTACTSCKKASDLTDVWFEATNVAFHDYADEFARLISISRTERNEA